jgi:hypothetical protein
LDCIVLVEFHAAHLDLCFEFIASVVKLLEPEYFKSHLEIFLSCWDGFNVIFFFLFNFAFPQHADRTHIDLYNGDTLAIIADKFIHEGVLSEIVSELGGLAL